VTPTNPFRSPNAHHVALALVAGVALVATLLVTTTPIRVAEARQPAPAPREPLVDPGAPAVAAGRIAEELRASVEPLAGAEQHGRFAAAWARAEAARREAERLAAERAAAERAAAERAAAERAAARRSAAGSGAGMGGGWAALRRCESGGNYGAVSASGTYRGAYQFSRSTWNAVAARSYPHLVGVDPAAASPADQDAMALALYRSSGASPWPHCGRHL
jgi:ferric-dicitrate binding protein FerR (iron transport regulator)